jgi:SAM-dependent methyltransferase
LEPEREPLAAPFRWAAATLAVNSPVAHRDLNLGCGRKRRNDCVNVDRAAEVHPDLVWDLDNYPYPLPESHFQRIYAHDVIEHLQSIPDFMREAHRLLAPAAVLEITTPHFSCANAYTDPTHRHRLGYFSFDYFTDASKLNFYSTARFEIIERQLVFQGGLLNRWVQRLANRHAARYELRFAWMFPAWFMIFRLKAIK